jgi:hypothetical protein
VLMKALPPDTAAILPVRGGLHVMDQLLPGHSVKTQRWFGLQTRAVDEGTYIYMYSVG